MTEDQQNQQLPETKHPVPSPRDEHERIVAVIRGYGDDEAIGKHLELRDPHPEAEDNVLQLVVVDKDGDRHAIEVLYGDLRLASYVEGYPEHQPAAPEQPADAATNAQEPAQASPPSDVPASDQPPTGAPDTTGANPPPEAEQPQDQPAQGQGENPDAEPPVPPQAGESGSSE